METLMEYGAKEDITFYVMIVLINFIRLVNVLYMEVVLPYMGKE
jgi:hypothetical protein